MSPSPLQQAIAARLEVNQNAIDWVSIQNSRLRSRYHESVLQWIANKQQSPAGAQLPPVPEPPAAWDIRVHTPDAAEIVYDAQFPGIPPRLEDFEGTEPVTAKYVDPPTPATPHGPIIGNAIGGGWFQAGYKENGREVQDKSPIGVIVSGTSRDGISGTFERVGSAVPPGWWLKKA